MRAPTQADLIALWEAGRSLEPIDRGVLAVRATSRGSENVADWPLGRRNRALAQLHGAAFGGALCGWTRCPECGEQLEFKFDGHSVANAELEPESEEGRLVTVGGERFRLPTSRDLAAAAQGESEAAATRRLLRACRVGPQPAAADWNEEEVRAIEERLAEADPLAEILLRFDCPACSASFNESLDIGDFVWAKIESQAKRILREVHLLASAYGWSESQILALSPARRSAYLDMVRA
jgi:hypothetical protein